MTIARRYSRHWPAILMAVLLITTTTWGITERIKRVEYYRALDAMYQKSFEEVNSNMGDLEVKLTKIQAVSSMDQSCLMLDDIWHQAQNIQSNLSQIPGIEPLFENGTRFINQLGDFCRVLAEKVSSGEKLSDEDRRQLADLRLRCAALTQELAQMKSDMTYLSLANFYNSYDGEVLSNGFEEVTQPSVEYPAMIYDGPFSDSLLNRTPKGLPGGDITESQALDAARSFWGDLCQDVQRSNTNEGEIPSYDVFFTLADGRKGQMGISRQGGKALWMMADGGEDYSEKLSALECSYRAVKFLEGAGFDNMVVVYHQFYEGTAVINCAPVQDGVVLYPDLVKVRVCRETGKICGMEAHNYWMNHIQRNLTTPVIAPEQAQAAAHPNFYIVRLALIPLDDGSEALCYELSGRIGNDAFLLYVNVENGREEKIFQIIDTENGTLVE